VAQAFSLCELRTIMSQSPDPFAPLPAIESHLDQISRSSIAPVALVEAMRYALLQGGKRLRPILAWQSAVACGAAGDVSLDVGAAVELVHAFSLVHDDLPAIDNDDLRRGRPTLHKHAGESMAILAGDAMLSGAFELLAFSHGISPPGTRLALLRELSHATTAMIHGQVWDTLGGLRIDVPEAEQLRTIHRNKTGALIRASCRMGAIAAIGEVDQRDQRLAGITAFGEAIGLMFQIADDLIDVEQPPEHAGKKTGKDAQAGKLTYPEVFGVAGSRSEITRLLDEAHRCLAPFSTRARSLGDLAEYLAKRTK
jgi:geranylgeranyl diphosphate synthase type II